MLAVASKKAQKIPSIFSIYTNGSKIAFLLKVFLLADSLQDKWMPPD